MAGAQLTIGDLLAKKELIGAQVLRTGTNLGGLYVSDGPCG